MSLVALGGPTYWPPLQLAPGPITFGGATQSNTFDATNDQIAGVFQSDISDSIAKIYMRVGTLTTAATMRMGVYALGTDGKPALTPTYWSANGTGATPSADLLISGANTWQTFTLTNAAVLVPGDKFSIVLSYVSGSTPSFIAQAAPANLTATIGQDQLQLLSNAGAAYGAAVQAPFEWIVEMTTAGVVHVPGTLPLNGAATLTAFNTGTTDEIALKFVLPMKCNIKGLRVGLANLTASSALLGALYGSTDQTTTTLAVSPSVDGDGTYSATQDGYFDFMFTTPYVGTAGTTYFASVRNTTANAVSLINFTTATVTNAIRAFGIGTNVAHLATRTYGAPPTSWSLTTTTLPSISLIIDQLDTGGVPMSRVFTGQ